MRIHLRPLHEQVIVLFGATSGIGLETALKMVEKGARVVIVGRNQEGLEAAVQRVREHARAHMARQGRGRSNGEIMVEDTVLGVEADAAEWDQVKDAADQAVAAFGRIDTWVQLAAVAEWALFEDTSPDEFRRIIDVNLTGQAYGAMAALPYLRQQRGGTLIFVSSVAGRVPIPYQAAYSASKHGIIGMADSLRMEMKHNNVPISVCTILPGSINTPLFNKARTKLGVEPEPMKPIYEPRVVAQAIMYAATHPVREIVVGGSAYTMQSIKRLSYHLASAYMQRTGFSQQRSNEVKSAQDPDNLYQHISGYNHVEGEYRERARNFSLYTWFATHPVARLALVAALMGGTAFLGYRTIQRRRKRSLMQKIGDWISHRVNAIEMPRLRRRESLPRRVMHRVTDGVDQAWHSLPGRHEPSLPSRVAHEVTDRFDQVRHNLPGSHQPSLWESLPLIGLLPFLRRKSRMEKAREQVKKQVEKMAHQLDKTREKLPEVNLTATSPRQVSREIAERVRPERKSKHEKEVVMETVEVQRPGGRKEVVYEKVKEKERKPSKLKEKETVMEKTR